MLEASRPLEPPRLSIFLQDLELVEQLDGMTPDATLIPVEPSDPRECPVHRPLLKAPNDSSPSRSNFAFNAKLAGMDESKVAPDTVLFFEADADWNTSGGIELLLPRPPVGHCSCDRPR